MRFDKARTCVLGTALAALAAVTILGGCGGAGPTDTGDQAPSEEGSQGVDDDMQSLGGPVYFFSDCQPGADARCIPGDNGNPGTDSSAPKRTLAGFDVNTLPAGSRVRFARGGAWTDFHVVLRNLNATPEQPIVLDSYAPSWGGTARPWMKVSFFVGLEFGRYNDTANDGGYTVRNLKLDGQGVADWGAWLRTTTRNVTLDSLEITGFEIGVYASSGSTEHNTAFTLRGSHIHHNSEMGFLGAASDARIEDNMFEANNFSGSAFNHAIYLGSGGHESVRMTVRGNKFKRNSVADGRCTGGNLTVHGQWDGLIIEANTITQDTSLGGCYGISIMPAYDSPEYFRHTVVRGNTIVNLGHVGIGAASAPGIVIENNLVVNTQATYQAGVAIPLNEPGPGDAADGGAIVRNNTVYFSQAGSGSQAIALRPSGAGTGLQMVSNLVHFGAGSNATHYCYDHPPLSGFVTFDHNLCHHAGGGGAWSASYATLAIAQAAGADLHGLSDDPLFVAPPSKANGWNDALQPASPAHDAGHPTLSSRKDRLGVRRTLPDIGSRE